MAADNRNAAQNIEEESGENQTSELSNAFFGTADQIVSRYTHCSFCGANLHFTHMTDFSRNTTQESARCPECGIKTRSTVHRLQ